MPQPSKKAPAKKPRAPKKPTGRPSKYTPELAKEITDRLSKGEPLAKICRDDNMPDASTVGRWKEGREELSLSIARAREEGFDAIALQCLEIADETIHDTIKTEQGERANSEWISRSKLRVETRLKLLAKWDPKRYGDSLATARVAQIELETPEDGKPFTLEFKWADKDK